MRWTASDVEALRQDYEERTGDKDDRESGILEAFDRLSAPDRLLMTMYAETRSPKEMARHLGVSPKTVERKIDEIRNKIFADYNGRLAEFILH